MTLGSLAFLSPGLLFGLLALPVIWWLLRAVPPAPVRVQFPATRILVGLPDTEKQSDRTPWWLTALRLIAAAALVLALAEPVLNPTPTSALKGNGPVALFVDNGWASGAHWQSTRAELDRRITEAESQGRAVVVAPTAFQTKSPSFRIEAPAQARSTAAALAPLPFAPDRARAAAALADTLAGQSNAAVVWLTDGIDHDARAAAVGDKLRALAPNGSTLLVDVTAGSEPLAVAASLGQAGRLEAHVVRAGGGVRAGTVQALSSRGQTLSQAPFSFASGATATDVVFNLPLELRNQVARVEIANEPSAGAVHLLDLRAQWHRIGILSGTSREEAQPLLAPLYYIERALKPFAEIARDDDANLSNAISHLIKKNISILMLADIGVLPRDIHDRVAAWVAKGGVLIRFAGPRLENGGDDLLPAPLRVGGRSLGGALSWSTPQPLAPITDDSLFAGLVVPGDVLVQRQVLTDPARMPSDVKVLARLKDGTPLVTSVKRGEGQLVLFHVTANSDWSNLPLSGLFVEMLRRLAVLGKPGGVGDVTASDPVTTNAADQIAAETAEVLAPTEVLDGFGILKSPPPTAQAIPAAQLADTKPSAEHPPGLYGPAATPRAFNLASPKTVLAPLPALAGFERRSLEAGTAKPLKPHLLTLGLGLLLLDILATLWLSGAFAGLGFARGRAALVLVALTGATVVDAARSPSDAALAISSYSLARPKAFALEATELSWPRTRPSTTDVGNIAGAAGDDIPFHDAVVSQRLAANGRPRGHDELRYGLANHYLHLAQFFPSDPDDPFSTLRRPNSGVRLPPPRPAQAVPTGPDARAIIATGKATIGYVLTGDAATDKVSEQGLRGLSTFLLSKTAVDPGDPAAINAATDEITFFPVLYWPVLADPKPLPAATLAKIDAYMKNGGMIIFDTRDAGTALPPGLGANADKGTPLQRLLGNLDLPRLEPVPETHVLTKSFYLLRSFPGRYDNGQLWVEAEEQSSEAGGNNRQARRVDGVSSILVTSNDFASAWAIDDRGVPLYPVSGGERQRDFAFRAGVNIVMYALTGNYKADQVHVPALLERLGQ